MDGSARMWISAIASLDPDVREAILDIGHASSDPAERMGCVLLSGGTRARPASTRRPDRPHRRPVALPEPIGLFERREAGVAIVAAPVPPPA
jgi:hypothetical protein